MAVTTAMVAATAASGAMAANASRRAARSQQRSADAATAESQRQFDVTQRNLEPYRAAGLPALDRLNRASAGDMSAFTASPDYNFRMQQGVQALDRSAAARGRLRSGGQDMALQRYGQGLAAGEFGDWWNRQMGMTNLGMGATNNLNAAGQMNSQNIQGNLIRAGDARAQGIINSTNAWQNALQQGVGLYGLYRGGYFNPSAATAPSSSLTPVTMPTWGFGGR